MCVKEKITKLVIDNVKKLVSENLPQLIEDSINECIYELVESEMGVQENEKITVVLDHISKNHGIPLDLLLRDIPTLSNNTMCRGVKKNKDGLNTRCTFKAVNDGYCKYHTNQGEKIKKRFLPNQNLHTHGPEKMFVKDCPACIASKGLIDLRGMIYNE